MSSNVQSSRFSDLISGLVFYGVIFPTGIARRLLKAVLRGLRPQGVKDTFWIMRDPANDANSVFRQY